MEHFLTGVGVPVEAIGAIRETPSWSQTPSSTTALSEATSSQLLASVTGPTLVLDSEGSSDDLTAMAAAEAGGMPDPSHRSLAGEWHAVPDDVLAPVLIEFFRS